MERLCVWVETPTFCKSRVSAVSENNVMCSFQRMMGEALLKDSWWSFLYTLIKGGGGETYSKLDLRNKELKRESKFHLQPQTQYISKLGQGWESKDYKGYSSIDG